jgi:hypothetical protein
MCTGTCFYYSEPRNSTSFEVKSLMRSGPISDLHQGLILKNQVEDLLHVDYFQPPLKEDKRRSAKPRLAWLGVAKRRVNQNASPPTQIAAVTTESSTTTTPQS